MDLVCEKVQKDATKGSRYSETQSNCWKRLPIGWDTDSELVKLPLKENTNLYLQFSPNPEESKTTTIIPHVYVHMYTCTQSLYYSEQRTNLPWVPSLGRADRACWPLRCRRGRCSCPPRGCWTVAPHLLSTLGGLRNDSQCVVCPALKIKRM